MATSKQKQVLIEKIKNERKFYELRFEAYGGEAVMGHITKEAYDYWSKRQGKLGEYLAEYRDMNMLNKVPKKAQLERDWYEHDDITHVSGCELSESCTLYIDQYDRNFKFEDTIHAIPLEYEKLGKYGIKCIETGTFDSDHYSVENKHYLFGQSFEKGVWHTEEKIKGGPHGLKLDQLHLEYQNIEGWPVICHVEYEGFEHHLQADTRGKSFTLEVREGYQSKDFGKKDMKNIWLDS